MKIRISYHDTEWPLYRQLPGNLNQKEPMTIHWRGHDFYVNQDIEECDVWVVNNILLKTETALCPPENTIFITGEPESVGKYDEYLLRKFYYLVTAQQKIKHPRKIYGPQGHQWFVGKSYDQLKSIPINKTKNIAIFASNLQYTSGHKKRFEFIKKIKKTYGGEIDWYGRGLNPFDDKWDVMPLYKFVIVIENSSTPYYFTEKIMDAFLCLCHPIYVGCTNITDYFSEKSMTLIDMNDWGKAKQQIDYILSQSDIIYNQSRPYIEESKSKCLEDYNFFGVVANVINEQKINPRKRKKLTFILNKNPSVLFRIYRKISNFLYGITSV